jgi:RNA polymerase sigma factor (sigma-70 family)
MNSGSEDDALDIYQDAIVALCKQVRLNKFDMRHEVAGFLYSVSRNLWINKAKRDGRMSYIPENFDFGDNTDFTDQILTKENEKTLKAITEELGQKCFELLKQSVFLKYSTDEIIENMGFSTANAVKTQKYKCKQKLLNIIEGNTSFQEVLG